MNVLSIISTKGYIVDYSSYESTILTNQSGNQGATYKSARGGLGWGGYNTPCRKNNSIIRAELMYRSGKDTMVIYFFVSRNSPNLLTDLCTTSRDGCCYLELEH